MGRSSGALLACFAVAGLVWLAVAFRAGSQAAPPLATQAPTASTWMQPDPEPAAPEWRALLEAVVSGEDPRAEAFTAWLREADDASRDAALDAALDTWSSRHAPALMPALGALRAATASRVAVLAERDPDGALAAIETFFFPRGVKDPEAWGEASLREALARLCQRPTDPAEAVRTGPRRLKALRAASRAKVREAIPAILRAAGKAKDEHRIPIAGDPYGPAMLWARQVISRNRRAKG